MNFKAVRSIVTPILLAGIVGVFQGAEIREKESRYTEVALDKRQERSELRSIALLKNSPSLGFRNFFANWGFLQFLQYFGDEEARETSGYDRSPNYLSAILQHDPYYRDFYLFLSESTTFYAGMPSETVSLMEEGLSHMVKSRASDSYYIWRYKGNNELLFLGDSKAAQNSFQMAAKWARASDDQSSELVAKLSEQTAAFLASDPDSKRAQIDSWSNVLISAVSDETRKRAIEKIESLGGGVTISEDGGVSVQYERTSDRTSDRTSAT